MNYANLATLSWNLRNVHFRPHSPRIMRNLHHLLTYYTLCFRRLTSGRELPKIPVNQAKFTKFAHISHELREFCAFRTKNSPIFSMFQISDLRQRTPENWSESTRFHAVRPQLPRITRNLMNPHP